MKHYVLYGAGGHARVVIDILHRQGQVVHAVVDDFPKDRTTIHGIPVYDAEQLDRFPPGRCLWIVAIGSNDSRRSIAEKLTNMGHLFGQAIHPSANIGSGVTIGPGTVLMAGTVINTGSTIGAHVIINTATSVDHDCTVGDGTHLAPGCRLCGHVRIGKGCFLCVSTSVAPSVTIGDDCLCGAGTVILRDLPSAVKAWGVPARIIGPSSGGAGH